MDRWNALESESSVEQLLGEFPLTFTYKYPKLTLMSFSPCPYPQPPKIYRQVHSKSSKSSKNEESAPTPAALPSGLASGAPLMAPTFYPSGNGNEDSGPSGVRRDSEGSMMSENFSPSVPTFGGYFQGAPPQDQMANQNHRQFGSAPNSAGSASSFNFAPTGQVAASSPLAFDPASRRNSIVKDDMMGEGDSSMSREEQALNRELVGSLTSNYLFIKGGLCKKVSCR